MNILITGGASGLGEAITRELASQQSGNIYFTYNKSVEKSRSLEREFTNAKAIKCNFKEIHELDRLISHMQEMDLDVLINNAFVGFVKKHFHKTPFESFSENFQNNIIPTIKITQQAISLFRKKKFGKIINILTSALISRPPVGWSEYVASKAYLASLSKSWAVENASFNITSNCISPSFMLTRLTSDTDERIIDEMRRNHPLKKLLTTAEVAKTVLFITESTQHLNGTNIVLNAASDIA